MRHRFLNEPTWTNTAERQRTLTQSASPGLGDYVLKQPTLLFVEQTYLPELCSSWRWSWQHLGSPEQGGDRRPIICFSSSSLELSLPSLCRHSSHCYPAILGCFGTFCAVNRFSVFSLFIFISLSPCKSRHPHIYFGKSYPFFKAQCESHLLCEPFHKHLPGSLFVSLVFSGIIVGSVPTTASLSSLSLG